MPPCLWFICFALFVWAPSAFAIGNIHLGRLEIRPEISYTGEYNDNIYFEDKHEQDDYIHTITPGIGFTIPGTSDDVFSAGYSVGVVRYSDVHDNDYEDHRAHVSLNFKTPKGLFVRALDRFQDTGDPFGSEQEFRIGTQTERWNNRAELHGGYEFAEKYGIEGIYVNFTERYDRLKDEYQDQTRQTYGGAVFYRVTGKTSLFGQYLRNDAEFDSQHDGIDADRDGVDEWNSTNSQDHSINNFFIGARIEPGGILGGELKGGYGTIDFDNDTDKNGNPYDDDSFWIVAADIGYQPLEKTRLSLNFLRSKQISTSADAINDVSATYLRTDVGLTATQTFTHRISMDFGFKWSYKDYLDERPGLPKKDFNLYRVNCSVTYLISDWLFTGLEYRYWDNQAGNSRYNDEEYTVNSVGVHVRAVF